MFSLHGVAFRGRKKKLSMRGIQTGEKIWKQRRIF